MQDISQVFNSISLQDTLGKTQDLRIWGDTQRALQLALRLGEKALEIRRTGVRVSDKSDGTPVTNADIEINDEAVSQLPLIRPVPVVSEENVKRMNLSLIPAGGEWWLIDPIDGTASYKNGYDGFGVCLSLIRNHRPIIGIFAAPAMDAIYFAAQGFGAFKLSISNASIVQLNAQRSSAGPFSFGGFYSDCDGNNVSERLQSFLKLNGLTDVIVRPVSAALKYCLVAEGELDMAGGWGSLDSWDISAADLIVKEAGGSFLDISTGQEFCYSSTSSKVNSPMAIGREVRVKFA